MNDYYLWSWGRTGSVHNDRSIGVNLAKNRHKKSSRLTRAWHNTHETEYQIYYSRIKTVTVAILRFGIISFALVSGLGLGLDLEPVVYDSLGRNNTQMYSSMQLAKKNVNFWHVIVINVSSSTSNNITPIYDQAQKQGKRDHKLCVLKRGPLDVIKTSTKLRVRAPCTSSLSIKNS